MRSPPLSISPCVVAALLRGARDPAPAFEFVRWRGDCPSAVTWTRAELAAVVQAEAGRIIASTAPGDRIVIAHPPGPAFVAAFLACLASGRIAVPAAAPLTAASKAAVARLAETTNAALILTGGDSPPDPAATFTFDIVQPDANAIAYLQFTSGSTQASRGAVITHRALRANLAAIGEAWGLSPRDRGVFWLPPFHDMGLVGAILAPVAFGVPSTLMHPAAFLQRPARWLELLSSRRATFSGGPNFAYDLVADRVAARDLADLDLSHWRVAVNGAEPVRRRMMRRFSELLAPAGFRSDAFAPGYGLAEAVLFVSARRPGEDAAIGDDDDAPADCGAPGVGIEVRIVDEKEEPCTDGETGAIQVRGDTVASGYWDAPDASQAVFGDDLNPWLRTGDLGFLRKGRLFVVGRAKDVLIRAGRKVHAADVEAAVTRALGRRASVAAFALAQSARDEDIVLVVEHATQDPDAEFARLRDAVADACDLTPDIIALCAPGAVRLTTSGKIARAATRDAWRAGLLPVRHIWRRPLSAAA